MSLFVCKICGLPKYGIQVDPADLVDCCSCKETKLSPPVRVGIDPGFNLGWAIVAETSVGRWAGGTVKAPRSGLTLERINQATKELRESLEEWVYAFPKNVKMAYVEEPEFFANAGGYRTAARGDLSKLTLMAGAIVGMLGIMSCPVTLVKPRDWKGQLPKEIVDERLAKFLKLKPTQLRQRIPTSHERDAYAMILSMRGDFKL